MRHFTIAIVFKSNHLLLAKQHRYSPKGPTYFNQSDKRDALTAFLSLRPQRGHKRNFVDSHFQWVFLQKLAFSAIGSYRLYSLITSAE